LPIVVSEAVVEEVVVEEVVVDVDVPVPEVGLELYCLLAENMKRKPIELDWN